MRIIKKYPNRRLYDTDSSQYITLQDIKKLVLARTPFKVIDSRTQQDTTNYILLQIIQDNENTHTPILTTEFLLNMIRFYGNPAQQALGQFLEQAFSAFNDQQQNLQNYFHSLVDQPILQSLTEQTQRALQSWQENLQRIFTPNDQKQAP